MTKVDIKRLDSVTKNDTTATEQINDNFKALQEAIENTLSRDGTGPNFMDADLDMNSYRIINSANPVEDNDIVNLKYVEERIGGAVEAAKTATSAATQAANSAQSALVSSTEAINTLRNTEDQLNTVVQYVDDAKADIDQTINDALSDVKQQALDAAQESIDTAAEQATAIVMDYAQNTIGPALEASAKTAATQAASATMSAREARVWATGEDEEVEEFAPGEDEHSSRGYADLSMALANAPEDTPVDASTLVALDIFRGPKGDKGDKGDQGEKGIDGIDGKDGDNGINGRSIGDIFYTTRLDTEFNGAVECNGTTYNLTDYTGNVTVGSLLADGKLPYVTMEEYASLVEANGSCRAFGWDGGVEFRVPLLKDVYIEAGTAETAGEFITESLPNITGRLDLNRDRNVFNSAPQGAFYRAETGGASWASITASDKNSTGDIYFDASRSSPTYQDGAKVKPDSVRYRAMIVLYTGIQEVVLFDYTRQLTEAADAEIERINNNTNTGDKDLFGSLNISGEGNHPLTVTAMAGTTASGVKLVDSNGTGETDIEQYAAGDRYGSRFTNKSTATGKEVSIDLYQTTAGKSVLDLSKPDTILAPQLLDILFPIGSYYMSEELTCPLADWMEDCKWEVAATNIGNLIVNVFRRIQ